ncbi:hypothetical protein ATANTOWER_019832 [Ataeniobius toweri]|uniref:Fibronectin type-III domain-containing protein n=1 Tax=Ataeniobius toweri TaxID=208326 RepID=A0ABU7B7P9_9TELE|nr:hypothetical protein [Ataeniobius toweri]
MDTSTQSVNDTEEVGPLQAVDISNPDTTQWILHELEPLSKYKLYLRSCTAVGCGPAVSEESTPALETTSSLAPTVGISMSTYVYAESDNSYQHAHFF